MSQASQKSPNPLRSSRHYWRLTLMVILVTFGGGVLWAALAPIEGAVIAAGQVVVQGSRKTIQHLEGGVVGEIRVKDGELVEQGAVLARLKDTVQSANLALIDGQLTELYARRLRLIAERDGDRELGAPSGEAELLATSEFAGTLAGQKQLFEARLASHAVQTRLVESRIVQQKQRIAGLRAQWDSLRRQLDVVGDELASMKKLHAAGDASKSEMNEVDLRSQRLTGDIGAITANVAEAESVIAEARLEITRLSEARRESAIAELRDIQVSIAELEEKRVTAKDALARAEIRAPIGGRIIGLSVHTVGGVVAPGGAMMEIVPEGDRLLVAARIEPQDVDKIKAGQTTLVKFSAFGSRKTPEADGVVRTVSADRLVDQSTGAPYYLVLIDIPQEKALERLLRDQKLLPGMPVEAFIRTGTRSALSYFLKPFFDSVSRSLREE